MNYVSYKLILNDYQDIKRWSGFWQTTLWSSDEAASFSAEGETTQVTTIQTTSTGESETHWVSHTSENNWEMLEFHFSSFYPEHFQSKHAGTISYSYCFFSFLMYALLFLFSIFDASFLISFSSACSFLRPMSDIPFVTVGQSSELQQVRNPK